MMRFARSKGRASARGFTLIEVMIAVGIMTFGLLAILAMQIHALREGRHGRHTTEATRVAQQRMERLHRLDWSHADLQPAGWTAFATVGVNVDTSNGTVQEQDYDIQHRVQTLGGDPNLRQIDVRVVWTEGNGMQRRFAASTVRHNDP